VLDQDQLVFIKADNAPNWSRVQSTQIFSGATESALEHTIPKNRVKGDLEVAGSTDRPKKKRPGGRCYQLLK
jgi:hypothetical protein